MDANFVQEYLFLKSSEFSKEKRAYQLTRTNLVFRNMSETKNASCGKMKKKKNKILKQYLKKTKY